MIVGNLGNFLKVGNNVVRVAYALDIDSPRLIINRSGKFFRLSTADKPSRHSEPGKKHVQLIIRAPIQMRTGHDVITRPCEVGNGQELRGLAR